MSKSLISKSAFLCVVLSILMSAVSYAGTVSTREPIRLTDGQALKSVYFFGHWWEPWKSDDVAFTKDIRLIKDLGFNTICVDHEVSQAINRDWYWLDREYRLAGEEGMRVLPWLQLQSMDRESLMKFSQRELKQAVNQDGQPVPDGCDFRDGEFKKALAHYINAYLDRYRDNPALLRIRDGRKDRPVVALMVEIGWRDERGLPLSFDDDANSYFRKWMKASHFNLDKLNEKWGTGYQSFEDIDPRDKTIFNYAFEHKRNMPAAVQEHTAFRARIIGDAMKDVAREVRRKHGDVLFAVEVAYPFNADHPDALAYRWNNANEIRIVDFADIVFIRTVGNTSLGQVKKDQDALMTARKKVVLAYRFYGDSSAERASAFALDCAMSANGLGYYNWNETADSASAIYDDPVRQGFARLMNGAYDMLLDTDSRHLVAGSAAAPVEVAPAPPVAPAVIEPAPVQPPTAPAQPQ